TEDGNLYCVVTDSKAKNKTIKNGIISSHKNHDSNKLAYCVTDVPPWYLCILLGI
ncbi:hypothetical protein NDU88_006866, partial [Pleurodeles waltl]